MYLHSKLTAPQLSRVAIISFSQWELNVRAIGEIAASLHAMREVPTVALWATRTPLKDVGWTTSRGLARALGTSTRDENLKKALRNFGLPEVAFAPPPIRRWSPCEPLPKASCRYRTAIRQLEYREASLGRAILQVHPDTNTPVTDDHEWPEDWLDASIRSYAWAYDQSLQLLMDRQATALIVFNGRFLHDSAAAAAAARLGLPVLSFDYGGNDTDFDLTMDETHDWSALQLRMRDMYASWDSTERDQLGSSWFEERRHHQDPRNELFVRGQRRGSSIQKPEGKKMVVYFSSSGDEISELELDWSEYFLGQPGALRTLAEVCAESEDTVLIVRTHPHKRHKPRNDVEEWHSVVEGVGPYLHIDEWSDIDSYELMRQADLVVTYGSTTGVEAAYLGRPVIVMGPSAYDELGCARRVRSVFELRDALSSPPSIEPRRAIPYGLMMRRRGFLHHFVRKSDRGFVIDGVLLKDARPIAMKLSHVLMRHQKRRLTKQPVQRPTVERD